VLAWAGIALFAAIAALAVRELASGLVRAAGRLDHPAVLPGLSLALVTVGAGLAILAAAARLADRGRDGERIALIVGISLLVGVRLAVAAVQDGVPGGEMQFYHELAVGVRQGACCFSDRPMGYPILLAGAYGLLGPGVVATETLNTVLAAMAGIALFVLVRGAYGPRAASLALVMYAIWPASVLMTVVRLPETAYDGLVVLGALTAIQARPGWRGSALTGAILGIAQYFRPSTPLLLLAYLLARIWPMAALRRALALGALPLVATFMLVLAPVIDHNLREHGEASISTSAWGGWSLYVGTNAASGGEWTRADVRRIQALGAVDPWSRSRIAGPLGVRRILDDPPRFGRLALRKFNTLWATEEYGVQYGMDRRLPELPEATFPALVSQIFYVGVVVAATLALYRSRKRLDQLAVLAIGTAFIVTAMHTFLEVRDRYHSYVVPLVIALAAGGLSGHAALTDGRPAPAEPAASTREPGVDQAGPSISSTLAILRT